jgi:hypothetical protein
MSKNSMTILAVSVCAGWGAVIWLASSYITGKQEPWDAHSLVYPLSLFVAASGLPLWRCGRARRSDFYGASSLLPMLADCGLWV